MNNSTSYSSDSYENYYEREKSKKALYCSHCLKNPFRLTSMFRTPFIPTKCVSCKAIYINRGKTYTPVYVCEVCCKTNNMCQTCSWDIKSAEGKTLKSDVLVTQNKRGQISISILALPYKVKSLTGLIKEMYLGSTQKDFREQYNLARETAVQLGLSEDEVEIVLNGLTKELVRRKVQDVFSLMADFYPARLLASKHDHVVRNVVSSFLNTYRERSGKILVGETLIETAVIVMEDVLENIKKTKMT